MADFSKQTRADWEKLAAREIKAQDTDGLVWHTPEGIPVKPLYTADDLAGLAHLDTLPGFAPFVRGPRATMYAGPSLDRPPVRRLLHGRGIQRLLSQEPGGGPDRPVGGLRPPHPPGLRLGPPAGRRRRRQGRCRHRFRRGHEDPLRRHPARQDVGVHDDERRRAAGDGHVHRRRRGTGRAGSEAERHPAERHPQGVHGPEHLYLPAGTLHADRGRHHRLHRAPHAQVQFDLHLRLSHAGSRGDLRPGTGLHAGGRHRVRPGRARQRPQGGRVRAPPVVLLRHRHEPLHGSGQAARGPPAVGRADAQALRARRTPSP